MCTWLTMHQKGLRVLLLLMQPQLLDLISNRLSLLKHITEPLIKEIKAKPTSSSRRENQKYTPLPMPMADLYAYLLKGKLVTPMFARPREGPPSLGFNSSKKCEHHFGAKGKTLEECYQLRDHVQDLIDNKLIQFDKAAAPNIITNLLPPHQERNVNAIITVEERVPNFSSLSFPWKAML